MKTSKKIMSVVLGGVLLATSVITFASPSKEQIDIWLKEKNTITSQWSKEVVISAYHFEILTNTSVERDVDMREDMTREEFTEVAMNYVRTHTTQFKLNQIKSMSIGEVYIDTTNEDVLEASNLGIVSGVGGGRFAPNDAITREEVATLLIRVEKIVNGYNDHVDEDYVLRQFKDSGEVSNWARGGVALLVDGDIMRGKDGGYLAPKDMIKREEGVSLVAMLFSRKQEAIIDEIQ